MPRKTPFDFAAYRTRIHMLAQPDDGVKEPRALVARVIEECECSLAGLLGAHDFVISTVRERSGFRKERLRHIHANPDSVKNYFEKQDAEKDNICALAFADPRFSYNENKLMLGTQTCHCVAYRIDKRKVSEIADPPKRTPPMHRVFPGRINKLFKELQSDFEENPPDKPIDLDKIKCCIVFGLCSNGRNPPIERMAAYYLTKVPSEASLKEAAHDCSHAVAEMFRTVELIRVRQRSEFERHALRQIIDLVPDFADRETSPSAAVTALLMRFNQIFKDHDYFAGGRFRTAPMEKDVRQQWVTYLSITYPNYDKEKKKGRPSLSVYPKFSAEQLPVEYFLISRPEVKSISKYLLYQYLRHHGIEPADAVDAGIRKDILSVEVDDEAFYKPNREDGTKSDTPTALLLTKNDGTAWQSLQFHATEGTEEANTAAAFLLCRKSEPDLPFAVIVFESIYPDAFSKSDIRLIQRLVDASAALLSNLKVQSYSVDYSERLKKTFSNYTNETFDGGCTEVYQVVYELMRLDCAAALKILKCDDPRVWVNSGDLEDADVRNSVRKVLDLMQSIPQGQSGREKWIWDSKEYLKKSWNTHIDDIHRFLQAVPSNNIYYCWLSSIARALADRKFDPNTPPDFKPFSPGFSAVGMYIIEQGHKTRQIAKLTEREKLGVEQRKYKAFVRHQVPLSARIPDNGIAFDTIGAPPDSPEYETDTGYGVIVSDLIAGVAHEIKQNPVSLLTHSVRAAHGKLEDSPSTTVTDVTSAIVYQFQRNTIIWKKEGFEAWQEDAHPSGLSPENMIEEVARTGVAYDEQGRKSKDTVDTTRRVLECTSSYENSNLGGALLIFLKQVFRYHQVIIGYSGPKDFVSKVTEASTLQALMKLFMALRKNAAQPGGQLPSNQPGSHLCPSRIHRDLNGNNLTWASDINRYVLIDFEHVGLGFDGVDQFKLLASIITETVSTARATMHDGAENRESGARVEELENQAVISAIRLLQWYREGRFWEHDHETERKILLGKLAQLSDENSLKHLYDFLIIFMTPLCNIEFGTTVPESGRFWRLVLRNVFYKQFEYSYRDLNVRDVDHLNAVSKRIDELLNGFTAMQSSDPLERITTEVPNVLSHTDDDTVIKLFYSFLAVLATIQK